MRSDKSIQVAEVTAFVMNWITVRMRGTRIGGEVVHPDVAFGIAALVCEILDRTPDSDLELPLFCDRIVDQLEVLAKAPGNVWFADEDGCTSWVPLAK